MNDDHREPPFILRNGETWDVVECAQFRDDEGQWRCEFEVLERRRQVPRSLRTFAHHPDPRIAWGSARRAAREFLNRNRQRTGVSTYWRTSRIES